MLVQQPSSTPPLFTVVVTTQDGEALPCLQNAAHKSCGQDCFVVGLAGITYRVKVMWNPQTNLGPCQFHLHIDGCFVGYTRVRDVGGGRDDCVTFDGFLVSKGETTRNSSVLHYRRFLFSDPHFDSGEHSFEENEPFAGLMTVEVYRFERNMSRRPPSEFPVQLWGSIASDCTDETIYTFSLPETKKFWEAASLATCPGEPFYKTTDFYQRRHCYGRKVGKPVFTQSIRYETAACLVRQGILNFTHHQDIIDWATNNLPKKRLLSSQPMPNSDHEDNIPAKKQNSVHEIFDLSQEPELNRLSSPASVLETCDLTGEMPQWTKTHQLVPDFVDLTIDDCSIDTDIKPIHSLKPRYISEKVTKYMFADLTADAADSDWMEISESEE